MVFTVETLLSIYCEDRLSIKAHQEVSRATLRMPSLLFFIRNRQNSKGDPPSPPPQPPPSPTGHSNKNPGKPSDVDVVSSAGSAQSANQQNKSDFVDRATWMVLRVVARSAGRYL